MDHSHQAMVQTRSSTVSVLRRFGPSQQHTITVLALAVYPRIKVHNIMHRHNLTILYADGKTIPRRSVHLPNQESMTLVTALVAAPPPPIIPIPLLHHISSTVCLSPHFDSSISICLIPCFVNYLLY